MTSIIDAIPIRAPVEEEEENGLITLIYEKSFTRFERWLQSKIGGPLNIRRKLDKYGTDVWKMCDGEHTVKDIIKFMRNKYREEMEPVEKRVVTFFKILSSRNLVYFVSRKEDE